jgi:hypothetical protein
MTITAEDIARQQREDEDRKRIAEDVERARVATLAEWAADCRKGLKVGAKYQSPRGEIYKLTHIVEKPDPKVLGSGKYRIQYLRDTGEADDDTIIPPLPLGTFEMMGGPK